jgi:hypothetical protein
LDDVRHEGRDYPKANIGGDSRQRRKAQRVVRPIHAVRLEIRVSRTREQVRRIENKQAEFRGFSPEQPSVSAEKMRQVKQAFNRPERIHDTGISRHDGADLDVLRFQGDRKRAGDVGQSASLDQGKYFRGDRKYANGLHAFNPSIIGCVIRRLASN